MSEFMCINDRIEPLFNAAAATQVAFQQPDRDVGDVMVVVTRYFGGIKLGAGGLVRAYSSAAQLAMDALPVQEYRAMLALELKGTFASEQTVRHWLGLHDGEVEKIEYSEAISMTLNIPQERLTEFQQFAAANGCNVRACC